MAKQSNYLTPASEVVSADILPYKLTGAVINYMSLIEGSTVSGHVYGDDDADFTAELTSDDVTFSWCYYDDQTLAFDPATATTVATDVTEYTISAADGGHNLVFVVTDKEGNYSTMSDDNPSLISPSVELPVFGGSDELTFMIENYGGTDGAVYDGQDHGIGLYYRIGVNPSQSVSVVDITEDGGSIVIGDQTFTVLFATAVSESQPDLSADIWTSTGGALPVQKSATKTWTRVTITDSGGTQVFQDAASVYITPLPLTIQWRPAPRVYDGTRSGMATSDAAANPTITLVNLIGSDDVIVTYTYHLDGKGVGTRNVVSALPVMNSLLPTDPSNPTDDDDPINPPPVDADEMIPGLWSISGQDADNYSIGDDSVKTCTDTSMVISPRKLELAVVPTVAVEKFYDGTASCHVNPLTIRFSNLIQGDVVEVTATGQFRDVNVGNNKPVDITFDWA